MNGLVGSALSLNPDGEITFTSLRQNAKILFQALQEKGVRTLVNFAPKNGHINQVVSNMGFEIVGEPMHPKKADKAILRKKQGSNFAIADLKLIYQTGQLEARLYKEAILANAFNLLAQKGNAVSLKDLELTYNKLANLFRNEYLLYNEARDTFKMAFSQEVKYGLYIVKDQEVTLTSNPSKLWLHNFYANIMRKAVDSYILTAVALRNLKQYQNTVDLEMLVKGLVSTAQTLYIYGSIKYLNSCISSMFVSSVGRLT